MAEATSLAMLLSGRGILRVNQIMSLCSLYCVAVHNRFHFFTPPQSHLLIKDQRIFKYVLEDVKENLP